MYRGQQNEHHTLLIKEEARTEPFPSMVYLTIVLHFNSVCQIYEWSY